MLAIKLDPENIKYINDPTEQMCIEAVSRKGYVLKYIKKQTIKIVVAAIKEDHDAIEYINIPEKDPSYKIIQYLSYP